VQSIVLEVRREISSRQADERLRTPEPRRILRTDAGSTNTAAPMTALT